MVVFICDECGTRLAEKDEYVEAEHHFCDEECMELHAKKKKRAALALKVALAESGGTGRGLTAIKDVTYRVSFQYDRHKGYRYIIAPTETAEALGFVQCFHKNSYCCFVQPDWSPTQEESLKRIKKFFKVNGITNWVVIKSEEGL